MIKYKDINIVSEVICCECKQKIDYHNDKNFPSYLSFGKDKFYIVDCQNCKTRNIYKIENTLLGWVIIDDNK